MFCDEAYIRLKAGDGGDGCISFHREKYVPFGPPDGGDGGYGGNIIVRSNININTLGNYRVNKLHKAAPGGNGTKNNKTGKDGSNLVLEVPVGTIIIDPKTNKIIADLDKKKDYVLVAKGGKGGLGNARFVNSVNQAPKIAEVGEPGEEKELKLELKLIADIGIIGFPSVGKSTLISVISNAKPKIADYHFTTLIPNLGVAKFGGKEIVVCDVPGIIEGASSGKGLGIKFLKHIERTKVLLHILDATSSSIYNDMLILNKELKDFGLGDKPQFIVINKCDLIPKEEVARIKGLFSKKGIKKIYFISAATTKNIDKLFLKVIDSFKAEVENEDINEIEIYRPHLKEKMDNFLVEKKLDRLIVSGKRIEQLIRMTNFSLEESIFRLERIFRKVGVYRSLKQLGLKEGDKFWILDKELTYHDL